MAECGHGNRFKLNGRMFADLRLTGCVLRAQKPKGGLMDKPGVQQSVACIKTFYPIFRIAIIMLLTAILVAQYCAPPPATATAALLHC